MKRATMRGIIAFWLMSLGWAHVSIHIVQPAGESSQVPTGQPLVIECEVRASQRMILTPVQITWQRSANVNGTPESIVSDRVRYVIERAASERNSRSILTITRMTFSDEGVYYCKGHVNGSDLSVWTQIIGTGIPEIVNMTSDSKPLVGYPVSVTCFAQGRPFPSLSWLGPGDTDMMTAASEQNTSRPTISTISASGLMMRSQLTLFNMTSQLQGKYTCVAESDGEKSTRTIELFLKVWVTFEGPFDENANDDAGDNAGSNPGGDSNTPSIVVTDLNDVTLRCFAHNVAKDTQVEWAYVSQLLDEQILQTGKKYTISTTASRTVDPLLSRVSSTLKFRPAASDQGFYACRVIDTTRAVLSSAVKELTVETGLDDLNDTDDPITTVATPIATPIQRTGGVTGTGLMSQQSQSNIGDSAALSGGVGAGVAVLVLLIVAAVFILARRARQSGTKDQPLNSTRIELRSELEVKYSNDAFSPETSHDVQGPIEQHNISAQSPLQPPARKKDSCEFPRDRVQLNDLLAHSKSGIVRHGLALSICNSGNWDQVAVKMLKETATDAEKSDFMKEMSFLRALESHSNVVRFLGSCTDREPSLIIMEYCEHGNLLNYIRQRRPENKMSHGSPLSDVTSRDILSFALQIAKGMTHISAHGIVHRDVAARNVLLTERHVCKVSDFGLARYVDDDGVYESVSKRPLPLRWMPPESLRDSVFTSQSDVWSYGVLLWELVTLGGSPYPNMTGKMVAEHVTSGLQLQVPASCPEHLNTVMTSCWAMNPPQRPTFEAVVERLGALLEVEGEYVRLGQLTDEIYSVVCSETSGEHV